MIFSMFEASIVDEFLHGSYGSQPHRCLLKDHFIVIVITFADISPSETSEGLGLVMVKR